VLGGGPGAAAGRFFDGTDLVPPGVTRVEEWRPDSGADTAARSSLWCGAARRR